MGRTPSYAAADAVRAARTLFWREGYEGASMSALQRATGLNPSSIYHAFGSKRALFEAAISNYLDEVVRPGLAPLRSEDVSSHALADYLEHAARLVGDPDGPEHLPGGCLLVNTACAGIVREPAVREVIAAYRAELVSSFGAGVAAYRPDLSADERARLTEGCVAALIAGLVLSRVDPAAARRSLEAARDSLDAAGGSLDPARRSLDPARSSHEGARRPLEV